MTVTTTDVNEAFAAERLGQIAAAEQYAADAAARFERDSAAFDTRIANGTLVPIGGDRFRVNQPGSWDNGEILTRRTQPNGVSMIMPEHGLDVNEAGEAALYTATPNWHKLGQVEPGLRGTADVAKVMRKAFIDFGVDKTPVLYIDVHGNLCTLPGMFVTRRDDLVRGGGMGAVGSKFEPLQNLDSFFFLEDLVGNYNCVWESAGAMDEGRKVFITMRLPEPIRVDPDGVNDEVVPYLGAINNHAGDAQFKVVATPWIARCKNTQRFAERDAAYAWKSRHTSGMKGRLQEAQRTLGLATDYFEAFAASETLLARTKASLADVETAVRNLWPAPDKDAPARTVMSDKRRMDTIVGLYESADTTAPMRGTLYAVENSITEYLDNLVPMRARKSLNGDLEATRGQAALDGAHDDKKFATHRLLLKRAGA